MGRRDSTMTKNSSKKQETQTMKQRKQQKMMSEWANQGIEIVQALQEPPDIPGHNELLKRIRAAACLPFYSPVTRETAVQFVSMAVNAAYWAGRGAEVAEMREFTAGEGLDEEEALELLRKYFVGTAEPEEEERLTELSKRYPNFFNMTIKAADNPNHDPEAD